jgi:peptidoglycan/xylan/chitin deacetylase (PgdA/CDA1 family)
MRLTLRNIASYFIARLLIGTGFVKRANQGARKGNYILSIYFHNPSQRLFIQCIKWLQKVGYSFIDVETLKGVVKGEIPFPKGVVIITVDDGWRENKNNIMTVANQYHIPVAIFITTQPVEDGTAYWWSYIKAGKQKGITKYSVEDLKRINNEARLSVVALLQKKLESLPREALSITEIQEIAASPFITIGSHTVSHPILTMCSDEKALSEIRESKNKIESWIQKTVDSFAFPNGSFSQRDVQMLNQKGFQLSFTTEPKYLTEASLNEMYRLPRFEVLDNVSFAENICRMSGVWFQRSFLKSR